MSRSIVVLDGRDGPEAVELRESLGRVLTPEESDRIERPSSPSGSLGEGADEIARIHDADAAIVLDSGSLERARQAGVRLCIALLPSFDLAWTDNLGEADAVLCAHDRLRDALIRRGIAPSRVSVVGPVVPDVLAPLEDRDAARERWQLADAGQLVVVPCDLFDVAGPEVLLVQLSLVKDGVTFLFDVGSDGEVADLLRERAPSHGLDAFIFAAEDRTRELWALADLCLGRPRGPEVSQALGFGLPLTLVPGGRMAATSAAALEASGVGSVADAVATLAVELERCLEGEALSTARQAVRDLDVGGGLGRVATKVRELLDHEPEAPANPRGLPHGLERVSTRGAPQRQGTRPSDEALDRRVEEELAALKSRLSDD